MAKEIYDAKKDPKYQDPYIDAEEDRVRKLADGREIPYHYVHGSFTGTPVKFTIAFPGREDYQGRFFQYLSPFPGPDEETASYSASGEDDKIGFALEHGAFEVESNMGSASAFGPQGDAKDRWKTSAAVAEYARKKAMEYYQTDERPVGIVYGGSGGSYKTMACIENTNAWDGAVPYVIGSPVSLPNTITMHAQGQRVLRHAFGKIVDALDAGGSGNPYENLNPDEAQMLKELTDMGFPPITWYIEANGEISDGSLPVLIPGIKAADPSYFTDFWTIPGYMGADPESTASRDRLQFAGTVKSVHLAGKSEEKDENGVDTAWKKMLSSGNGAYLELEDLPEGDDLYLKGVNITFTSGDAKGKQLLLGDMIRKEEGKGGYLTIGMCYGLDDIPGVLSKVKSGDTLTLDNSDYIAVQSYYRHQVPADLSFHAWDQFRNPDGTPALPQRKSVLGYHFTGTGTVQDGDIQGKVIVVQGLMDESTCPWCGDWYKNKVAEAGHADDFRIYYMQRCLHGDVTELESNMVVYYLGALRQALLDMADWIQKGKEPLPSTVYEREGGQISVPSDVRERKGMQASITLTANGKKRCEVRPGEEFTLEARAQVPEGAGEVTSIAFGFDDIRDYAGTKNAFPEIGEFTRTEKDGIHGAVSTMKYHFDKPGTYFIAARVTSERNGDEKSIYTQVRNLDRVRIVVK